VHAGGGLQVNAVASALIASIALCASIALFALFPNRALAATCESSGREPAASSRASRGSREQLLHDAREDAYAHRYGDARAAYLWLLARDPRDLETLAALARADAWEGCWALAESEYRIALRAHPEDADVRGGLVDVLMWQQRWSEADGTLQEGLAREPKSPTLLARAARLAFFRGDATEAKRLASLAEELAPDDEEIRELRDAIFVGMGVVDARGEFAPGDYPNVYTYGIFALQRVRRFELSVDEHVIQRTAPGVSIVDLRSTLGIGYHPAVGVLAALELGYGAPATAIPHYSMKLSLSSPIGLRFTGSFAYSLWEFDGHREVHIFNPTLAYQLTDTVEIALRWWTAYIAISPSPEGASRLLADTAHSGGVHVGWHPSAPWIVTADYTYGVGLDANLTIQQLFTVRSHVFGVGAGYRINRALGVQGTLGIESRRNVSELGDSSPAITIPSIGAGFSVRW